MGGLILLQARTQRLSAMAAAGSWLTQVLVRSDLASLPVWSALLAVRCPPASALQKPIAPPLQKTNVAQKSKGLQANASSRALLSRAAAKQIWNGARGASTLSF